MYFGLILMGICGLAFFLNYVLPVLTELFAPHIAEDIRNDQYYLDARRRGLTPAQASDELLVRTVWAGIRWAASEATCRHPADYHRHINDAIREGIRELKEMGRSDLIRPLVSMHTGLPDDVLSHEAMHFVGLLPSPIPHGFKPDPVWAARRASALRVER